MKKIKLVIGTINDISASISPEKLERAYENSYKPFLTLVHEFGVPVTTYYNGELLSWIIDKHDGMQMLFNDLFRTKKIEMLGGGYYSPLFSLIPKKDRVGQIEFLTTDIRKRFGKRPRGLWITEKVWEPSIPMTMNYAGMEYTFIDEEFFEDAGLFNGELFQPCITEDQGKIVVVLPISNRLISEYSVSEPEEMIESIIDCRAEKESRVATMLLSGGDIDFSMDGGKKLRRFFELLEKNSDKIEVVLPGKLVRSFGQMKKVYFGCVSPGDVGRWSGPVYRDWTEYENIAEEYSLNNRVLIKPINTQSFFRHFLSKYPESNNLYSRMINVHYLISQVRGDKQRKKCAENELWKSQEHTAFWHGGDDAGIYSNRARKRAYASLIEAEKYTRERGVFKTSLVRDDFDMDGLQEYIYQGAGLNAFIHLNGGVIFELDYLRTSYNYLDTMARHREWYHSEGDVKDWYTRNAFVDHFFRAEEKLDAFCDMTYRENGDFVSRTYKVEKYNREQKIVKLCRNGNVKTKKSKFPIQLRKEYSFKRNTLTVAYEIINLSDSVLNTVFGSEINLSFEGNTENDVSIHALCGQELKVLSGDRFEQGGAAEVQIEDLRQKTNLIITSGKEFELWGCTVSTRTGTGRDIEDLYQSTAFVPRWRLSINPGKTWQTELHLRIEKK